MEAFAVFMLLHNTPNFDQNVVWQSAPMPFEQCDIMQRAVWAEKWPELPGARTVPDDGPVPVTDAACVPLSELKN